MSRWIRTLTLFSLAAYSSNLLGWGNGQRPLVLDTPQPPRKDFPLQENQGWYTKESLLIWKPSEGGLDYASHLSVSDSLTTLKTKAPEFNWGTGARLAIGRYLPNHNQWDISLTTTYFYGSADNKTSASPGQNSVITANWASTLLGNDVLHGSVNWRLNYFTWDLMVGRNYLLTQDIVFHPSVGLRAGLLYTDYKSKYSQQFSGSPTVYKTEFESDDTLWGIGPRVAMDLAYNFKSHWAILGNIGISLLYSGYDVEENINGAQLVGQVVQSTNLKTSSSGNPLTTNIEGAIGLGWEQWVRSNTVRVAASFMFEATQWFDINHFYHFEPGTTSVGGKTLPISQSDAHSGNLGLMGFSINLQVDF
jgi:hypothetical protein